MMRRSYPEVYRESVTNPRTFWAREAEALHWFQRWDQVLDDSQAPFVRWFV
jgi:propionyl-CoA synthetase